MDRPLGSDAFTDPGQPPFQGYIDGITPPYVISGWAIGAVDPEVDKLVVVVTVGGKEIGRAEARDHRADLVRFGSGGFGFSVFLSTGIPFWAIYNDAIEVSIWRRASRLGELTFDDGLRTTARLLECAVIMHALDTMTAHDIEVHMRVNRPYIVPPIADALTASISSLKADHALLPIFETPPERLLSTLTFKAGMRSPDLTAGLGRDGTLFLLGGSNHVEEQFAVPYGDPTAERVAEAWAGFVRRRSEFALSIGAAFVQTVVPEKLSVMRELWDGKPSAPAAILHAFEAMIAASDLSDCYVSGLASVARLPLGTPFRKIDSHFSPRGAQAVFADICAKLGLPSVGSPVFDQPILLDGDLSRRFFGHDMYEAGLQAAEPWFRSGIHGIESVMPPTGYIGRRMVFRNEHAPIRKKVLLFGNSFADNPPFQGSLSYWFSTWFEEYHFVFAPSLDADYARKISPDILICQTVERFMPELPAS